MTGNLVVPPKVKLTLGKMRVLTTWEYNSDNTDCKLCHKDLTVPVNETGSDRINGNVMIGICNHGFHSVCINAWIDRGNVSCPHCMTVWKTSKNVGSSVYVYK